MVSHAFIAFDLEETKQNNINIVDGGSRNRLLNQLPADITGLKVIAGLAEATSIGNVMMQTVAMVSLRPMGKLDQ